MVSACRIRRRRPTMVSTRRIYAILTWFVSPGRWTVLDPFRQASQDAPWNSGSRMSGGLSMASHAHSFILGALCTAAVVACHPRPLTSGMPGPGDKKVITEEMIAHTGASTAWDVLRREEPQMTF